MEEIETEPISNFRSVVMGFFSGTFMGAGIFASYGAMLQFVLFVIGFLIVVDTVFPSGRRMYGLTTVFFLLLGSIVFLTMNIADVSLAAAYMFVIFILTVIAYIIRGKWVFGRLKERLS